VEFGSRVSDWNVSSGMSLVLGRISWAVGSSRAGAFGTSFLWQFKWGFCWLGLLQLGLLQLGISQLGFLQLGLLPVGSFAVGLFDSWVLRELQFCG